MAGHVPEITVKSSRYGTQAKGSLRCLCHSAQLDETCQNAEKALPLRERTQVQKTGRRKRGHPSREFSEIQHLPAERIRSCTGPRQSSPAGGERLPPPGGTARWEPVFSGVWACEAAEGLSYSCSALARRSSRAFFCFSSLVPMGRRSSNSLLRF